MSAHDIETRKIAPEVLTVRVGPAANCSSMGSAIDVLFLSAAVGGALLVAVAAALSVPPRRKHDASEPHERGESDDDER